MKFVKDVSSPTYERQLIQLRTDGGEPEEHEFGSAEEHEARMRQSASEDPLFDRERIRARVGEMGRELSSGGSYRLNNKMSKHGIAHIWCKF